MSGTAAIGNTGAASFQDLIAGENLSIELTTECNSSCSHCFVRAQGREHASLTLDEVRDILAEGHAIGFRRFHFTGGEPLLWAPLHGAIDYAYELGYETGLINTNGALLDCGQARALAKHGKKTAVSISIQGDTALHDGMRGRGSHEAALRGVANALDAGLACVIFTVVGKSLLPALPQFMHTIFTRYPGIERVNCIQLIRVKDDSLDLTGELLSPADFITLVRMLSFLSLYGLRVALLENPLANAVAQALGMPWLPGADPLHREGRCIILADKTIAHSHSAWHPIALYERGSISGIFGSGNYLDDISPDTCTCPACAHYAVCCANRMTRPSEQYRDIYSDSYFCKRVMDLASV